MVRVKICGITNIADALVAVEAGADALGFNFYSRSPRYLQPEQARAIIKQLPSNILAVGIFVNESRELIEHMLDFAKLHTLQLHGDETPEMCNQLGRKKVIKAFRGRARFDPETVKPYANGPILLDAYDPDLAGGSGRTVDWRLARRVREIGAPLYLAGGLTVENVAEAIVSVEPYAVDVCSGVERAPGLKDHALVRRFVEVAKGKSESGKT
jgi:phosphoribosylanthranilate isomerase